MYTSVLVPLDRSPVAELALPFAVTIAERAKATLELASVHRSYVHDNPQAWAVKVDAETEDNIREEEQAYLAETAQRVTTGLSLSTTTAVLDGSVVDAWAVADSLLEEAQEKNVDLIVMTTRVRGLVSRLGLGSVADELVRRARVPVLLIWPTEEDPPRGPEPVLNNFLIPLDGSPLSEEILGPALELARLLNARCTLLRVAEPTNDEDAGAEGYLEQIAAAPRQQGLQVQTLVVASRDPAEAILEAAQSQQSNLIALATRGHGGFKRLVLGSVADQIVRNTPFPVLVQCPLVEEE